MASSLWMMQGIVQQRQGLGGGEIDKHTADGVNKLLVENKCDFASRKVVSTGGAEEHANSLNNRLLEASATSAHNVEEVIKQRFASQQVRSGGGRWREVVEHLTRAPAVSAHQLRPLWSTSRQHQLCPTLDLRPLWSTSRQPQGCRALHLRPSRQPPAVSCAAPAPVVEYLTPAPAVSYAGFAPAVEYLTPAAGVPCAAPAHLTPASSGILCCTCARCGVPHASRRGAVRCTCALHASCQRCPVLHLRPLWSTSRQPQGCRALHLRTSREHQRCRRISCARCGVPHASTSGVLCCTCARCGVPHASRRGAVRCTCALHASTSGVGASAAPVVEYLTPATSGALSCTCTRRGVPHASTNTSRGRRACTSLGRVRGVGCE